jgi:hypothetical protein
MARPIQEIYDAILTEKAANADLAGLTSTSNTAIWRLWAWITAAALHLHETLWDGFKKEVEEIAAEAIPGTASWYVDQCKAYQHNDTLSIVDYRAVYATENPSAQIVKQAALTETSGALVFKVAKDLSGTSLQKLSNDPANDEVAGLTAYLNKIKFAGTILSVLSANGDRIQVQGGVFYYNPIHALDDVKADLDAKVNALLHGLPFNGTLYRNKIVDAIESTLGYVDFDWTAFKVRKDSEVSFSTMTRSYVPFSGYVLADTAFSLQLTFVADVQS